MKPISASLPLPTDNGPLTPAEKFIWHTRRFLQEAERQTRNLMVVRIEETVPDNIRDDDRRVEYEKVLKKLLEPVLLRKGPWSQAATDKELKDEASRCFQAYKKLTIDGLLVERFTSLSQRNGWERRGPRPARSKVERATARAAAQAQAAAATGIVNNEEAWWSNPWWWEGGLEGLSQLRGPWVPPFCTSMLPPPPGLLPPLPGAASMALCPLCAGTIGLVALPPGLRDPSTANLVEGPAPHIDAGIL